MSIKSIAELLAQADTSFPDNSTQLITPAVLRTFVKDFLDSVAPAIGGITLTSLAKALNATPSPLSPWNATLQATAGVYTTSVALGEVIRYIATAALTGATDFVTGTVSVEGPSGGLVTLELYKNGVATGYKVSVTTNGAGKSESAYMAGVSYNSGADVEYRIFASGDAGNYIFSNGVLQVQAVPVRSYV